MDRIRSHRTLLQRYVITSLWVSLPVVLVSTRVIADINPLGSDEPLTIVVGGVFGVFLSLAAIVFLSEEEGNSQCRPFNMLAGYTLGGVLSGVLVAVYSVFAPHAAGIGSTILAVVVAFALNSWFMGFKIPAKKMAK